MIKLSVALPVFNSKEIVWSAMESLCRQKGVICDWELVIAEENENSFGFDNFMQYEKRLFDVGCVAIKYIKIEKWIPLGEKWKLLANNCNENSIAFVLQAADCYSEPFRIKTTYNEIVKNDNDWIQNTKGLFFNIKTKKHILYNAVQQCGLNMATKTQYVKKINIGEVKRFVDGYLFRSIRPKKVLNIVNDDWMKGVDTHGLNNISKGRETYFHSEKFPFEKTDLCIRDLMPKEIYSRLYNLKITQ